MGAPVLERVLVWDWPTRIGHWLMAASVLVAYLSGDSEEWRLVHVMAGGALAGLVAFRLTWGGLGSRHARFSSFVRSPLAAGRYLLGLLHGQAPHHTGHNPAGGLAIVALLLLGLFTAATGWPMYREIGGERLEEWLEDLHEGLANAMLLVVFVHLAGVAVGSLAHRENLPRAMLTGYKLGAAGEAIRGARLWAVPLLLGCAGFSAWWLSR